MPKGYIIAHIDINDPEAYARYAAAAIKAIADMAASCSCGAGGARCWRARREGET